MTDLTYTSALPDRNFQVNVTNPAAVHPAKTEENHRAFSPQEIAFEKSGMRTLLVCSLFAFMILFSAAFMMNNFFAIKLLSSEVSLILAAIFIVKKL